MARLIAPWVCADDRDAIVARFRELYPDHAIASTRELDGVRDALQAVRAHHGRIIVITGKFEVNAALHLNHLDLPHDALVSARWADGKTQSLLEFGASVYVGDHPVDLLAAKAADAIEVRVPSGAASEAELLGAVADVVLDSLHDFAEWLEDHVATSL